MGINKYTQDDAYVFDVAVTARRLFGVGLRIIGVTQELHVLVFVSVTTCDSALTDCD